MEEKRLSLRDSLSLKGCIRYLLCLSSFDFCSAMRIDFLVLLVYIAAPTGASQRALILS